MTRAQSEAPSQKGLAREVAESRLARDAADGLLSIPPPEPLGPLETPAATVRQAVERINRDRLWLVALGMSLVSAKCREDLSSIPFNRLPEHSPYASAVAAVVAGDRSQSKAICISLGVRPEPEETLAKCIVRTLQQSVMAARVRQSRTMLGMAMTLDHAEYVSLLLREAEEIQAMASQKHAATQGTAEKIAAQAN